MTPNPDTAILQFPRIAKFLTALIGAAVLVVLPFATVRAQSSAKRAPIVTTPALQQPFVPLPVAQELPVAAEPGKSRTINYAELSEFGAESHENWDAVQDGTGRVFVANGRGVLVYDGADWKVVTTPRVTAVRSLAVGPGNRVFAGAQGEFGYLIPDSTSFRFESLSEMVREEDAGFGNVWSTRADADRVYFQAPNHLFVWDGTDLKTLYSEASFHTSFLTDIGLVLRQRGVGLVRYVDGVTRLIPGGEYFADMRVFVLERRGTGWLVGTRDNGFHTLRSGIVTPFPTAADSLLKEYWLYTAAQSNDGELILGTLGAGLIGLDAKGRVTSRVTQETGLPDSYITSITPIRPSGFLATTQNNGLYFFEPAGISSRWADLTLDAASHVTIHADTLFVASGRGLETTRLDRPGAKTRLLQDKTTYQVQAVGDVIYAGTDDGVQIWKDGKLVTTVLRGKQVMALAAYKDGVAAGHRDGLAIIDGMEIRHEHAADGVRSLAVSGRDIWYATLSSGLSRLTDRGRGWDLKEFGKADGLPADDRLEVVTVGDGVRVYADDSEGIYKMAAGWFARDEELSPLDRVELNEVWNLAVGPDGSVWIGYPDRIERAMPGPMGYTLHETPALTFARLRHEQLFAHEDGSLWFNREGSVVRYSPDVDGEFYSGFDVILREVRTRRDHKLIFAGLSMDEEGVVATANRSMRRVILPFKQNAVTASFSAVYPIAQGAIEYAWSIGSEGAWSTWAPEAKATLEDLWEGNYDFHVKARDEHGYESSTVTFRFTVLPPWHRTWWAYLLYTTLAAGLIWFAHRYQVMVRAQKEAARQALQLEQEKEYRMRLEEANLRLVQANKLKDEFLAKTSHELRTPITAILGFTNILRDEIPKDKPYREFLDIIQESGDRLMGTLDDLLELAELRSGTRQLTSAPTNLAVLLDTVVAPMRFRAGEKGVFLRIRGAADVSVSADVSALRKILWNLVDNAVKFTEAGGINVRVSMHEACDCSSEAAGCVEIVVQDSGIGIDERFIPQLFDEFLQESGGESRSHNGTGLGLTIVGGLVELIGGEIEVESEKRVGSTFTVRIPVTAVEQVGGADSTDRPPSRRERDAPGPGTGETA